MLLLGAAGSAIAKTASSEEQPARTEGAASRLVPSLPPPGTISPPVAIASPRTSSDVVPDVAPGSILSAVELCMAVVSPDLELNIAVLTEAGWGWSSPEIERANGRQIETASYFKQGQTITLVQNGNYLSCRLASSVHHEAQVAAIFDTVRTSLKGIPATDLPSSNPLRIRLSQRATEEQLAEIVVTEGYMITFDSWPGSSEKFGYETHPSEFMLLGITIAPIAPSFRLSAQSQIPQKGSE